MPAGFTREVKNGKVAFKGGQCGRMDHRVWQVVPGTHAACFAEFITHDEKMY